MVIASLMAICDDPNRVSMYQVPGMESPPNFRIRE